MKIPAFVEPPARFVYILWREGIFGILRRIITMRHGFTVYTMFRKNPHPIVVFQMGKVGSVSVQHSVFDAYRAEGRVTPVFHVHILTNFEEIEKGLKSGRLYAKDVTHIQRFKTVRDLVDEYDYVKWSFISLVREPVARNVGAFFHNLRDFMPDWKERQARGQMDFDELQELFLKARSIHNAPVAWFETQLEPVLGINVFASPFPIEAGYKIYTESHRGPLLLFRLEDLNRVAPQAMKEFLGLENFKLHNTNVGDEKDYAELYSAFKKKPLPREYVESVYNIKMARHFYTEAELEAFARRWTGRR